DRLIVLLFHLTYPFFFFNDTATTEIYTLSLHDALPISDSAGQIQGPALRREGRGGSAIQGGGRSDDVSADVLLLGQLYLFRHGRSEEHTSELQSRGHLVCRLLLEKKKNNKIDSKSV